MLIQVKNLNGYKLGARDGEIGKVKEFYFDDLSWTIRYLVADTGDWLSDRRVLISPYALKPTNKNSMVIPVHLTRKQIEDSPSLDTHKPVSRQYEMSYYPYYGWPAYWGGPDVWGSGPYPTPVEGGWAAPAAHHGADDPHLRSTSEVGGYSIEAQDGEIGHIKDFVIDDETWAIRYLIVDTQNWWPGKKVLISTLWIDRISWSNSQVKIHMTRESIRQSPEFSEEGLITRDYEAHLHGHYKRDGYWVGQRPLGKSA